MFRQKVQGLEAEAMKRDAAKERLAAMMSSKESPGSKQAEVAVKKKAEIVLPVEPEKPVGPKVEVSQNKEQVKKNSSKKSKVEQGRAEKISVSLHPADQVRAEKIEETLRKKGLIARRAPTSFLLKVALASFDPNKVENLDQIVDEIKSQDGRGKWMKLLT